MGKTAVQNSPKVIALDYYDGPLEGVSMGAFGCRCCYFKLLAWDDLGDNRLFAIVSMDCSQYEEIATALASAQPVPDTPVWLPQWKFASDALARRVSLLLDGYSRRSRSPEFLCLNFCAQLQPSRMFPVSDQVRDKIEAAAVRGGVSDLNDWAGVLPIDRFS
ncbi:hypothetical protein K4L06_13250 [Lysobacter sp. BMK333-48F3]|uniref:hypothetical protein n=1 Tax=Lysobacter sp. BMK333-48F3 TaxID=2867962 RepID=UPI001C8C3C42|nr:hypothetical protein [Lysobacter sp. BMK333-48F3]MBX9402275.1 hypothetical protein [Lysobacter sp. BMK333-48F3]